MPTWRAMSIRTERDERDYRSDHYQIRLETTIIIITVIILRGVWVLYYYRPFPVITISVLLLLSFGTRRRNHIKK